MITGAAQMMARLWSKVALDGHPIPELLRAHLATGVVEVPLMGHNPWNGVDMRRAEGVAQAGFRRFIDCGLRQ